MQTTEKPIAITFIDGLPVITGILPMQSQQALTFSHDYTARYMLEHADNGSGLSWHNAASLAAARYEWVLLETRKSLNNLFSEGDISALNDCYPGAVFYPHQMNRIASDLCDHLGIDVDAYETSDMAPLIDTLRGLDAAQCMTLADALEQAWYRGMKQENLSPKAFFATLGIDLT